MTLKRELWTKLLTTAPAADLQEDDLLVEHTRLVAMAEIIGHAAVGIDPADPTTARTADPPEVSEVERRSTKVAGPRGSAPEGSP